MIQLFLIDLLFLLLSFGRFTGSEVLLAAGQQDDCKSCHDDLLGKDLMHYPAGDDCMTCHESTGVPHPSEDSAGFRLMDRVPELCYYCHEENQQRVHPHQPLSEGQCLDCHDPHSSGPPSLLRLPDPELCLSCHNRDYRTDFGETTNIHRLVREK